MAVCAADAVSPALTGPLSATVAAGCDGCLSQLHRNEGIIKTAAHTSIFQHLFMTSLLLRIRDGRLRLCKQTPVILLTARDTVMDKVAGLDTGANDYVTKSFHIEELFARIRVLARAGAKGDNGSVLKNADIVMDRQKRLVFRGGRHVTLTKTQFDLLEYFLMNLDIVLSREQLLGAVWRYDYAGDSNVVDVYVRYVRNRLGEPADGKLIESVRGIGYVMRSQPVEEAQ